MAPVNRPLVLGASVVVLVVVVVGSIVVGSTTIAPSTALGAFTSYDPTVEDHLIVRTVRLQRTMVGLAVGAALGVAGATMQGLTRNPLADPGVLGVDAGAALFVVVGLTWLGTSSMYAMIVMALAGAAVASAVVYAVGSLGRGGPTPVKLTLVGAAFAILLSSITAAILLVDRSTFELFRFWGLGSIAGRGSDVLLPVLPFLLAGVACAAAASMTLNALALGDDLAVTLGIRLTSGRVLAALAIVLLSGGATAAAGPIAFVGLVVAHVVRWLGGADHRWMVPMAMALGAVLLIGADIVGRVLIRPAEINAGVVTAGLGGAVFIALARRRQIAELR